MILTELTPHQGFASGPYGDGYLILAPDPVYVESYEADGELIEETSHSLWVSPSRQGGPRSVRIARARAYDCEIAHLWYIQAHLGRIPLVIESTDSDTMTVRVGYRHDRRHEHHTYRPTQSPGPRILYRQPPTPQPKSRHALNHPGRLR